HVRKIKLRVQLLLVIGVQTPLLYVRDYADNLRASAFVRQEDVLPDGIFVGEILFCEGIVDHNDVRGVFIVLRGEKSPALQRSSHHIQITLFHHVAQRHVHFVIACRFWLAFDPEQILVIADDRRRSPRERNGLNTGNRCQLVIDMSKSGANRGRTRHVHRRGKRNAKRQHVVRIEARVHFPECAEAADHQSRGDQQYQRHRHFYHHKNALRAVTRTAAAAPAFLERIVQIRTRRFQRRTQSKENPACQRYQQRKKQHTRIQPDLRRARKIYGQLSDCYFRAPPRQHQANRPTRESEQEAFRQKLAKQPSSAGSHGRSYREFTRAHRRPGQHQIGHVHASDQKHKANCGKQNQQKYLQVLDHGLFQRKDPGSDALVSIGKGGRKVARDALHVCPCLFNGDTGLEPADAVKTQSCAA